MITRFDAARRSICALMLSFAGILPVCTASPAPSQVYYVPFPEDHQLAGYVGISSAAVDPLAVFVSFSASANNTVIYYDHWEDGYEEDITRPRQSSTEIFGDANAANGYPPGNAGDLISAGTMFSLRNYVNSTAGGSVFKYDARDKIAAFKPISLTKTSFPASTNSLLAGCVEVFERGLWGTEYRVPVGVNMPTTTATTTLTWDANIFDYTALSIMAGEGGATVQIDADNNGVFEQTVTLAEGGTSYVTDVNVGGRVLSDRPVQVVMFSGRPTSNYQSRDTSLLPTYRWSSSYYAPVSTATGSGTSVFLYNPGASAITVSYDYRSSATAYTTSTVNVPAGGNARVTLSPSDNTTNFGAYQFYTTGGVPAVFYAFCAVDAASTTTGNNQAYDGGFTLVGKPSLTTQVLVSLGIGRDPYSTAALAENGNPVWITTVGNGHAQETVYVDYNGDNAGPLTDPNGNRYDVSYSLRELEQRKLIDPDGDQSGMLVYVLNPNVKIAAAWAQDPSAATAGQPGLDVATLIPPLREGDASKGSSIVVDADGDGFRSPGDTLEYDIRTINTARTSINGPFTIKDNLPVDLTYVTGTTEFRYSVGGAWQAWVAVPDDGSGTAFPLDGPGFSVPGTLGVGQQVQVVFHAAIKTYPDLTPGTTRITNTGSVDVTPYGISVGLEWSDLLYGSIGDRVWVDSNGDGVQDVGEAGLNGVTVYADGNNNGSRDPGEPFSISSGDGDYLLAGLLPGNYIVRVDSASVAALSPGYGPTHDIDGIASSYVASVTLAAAQDRTDVDFGFRVGASVGDRVWMDRDGDGVQEMGEPGINGVRVFIDSNGNGAYNVGEPNSISFGDGSWFIGNLAAGSYPVRIDTGTLPSGVTPTFDFDGVGTANRTTVALLGAQHRPEIDFGYRGTLSIGDLVWNDVDANASRVVYDVINGRIDINSSGGADNSDDGFIGATQIINGRVDLNGDGSTNGSDAGTFQGISVIGGELDVDNSGSVTNSDDATGAIASEVGIANVRVYLDGNGNGVWENTEAFATTNASGIYSISNLPDGNYTVRVDTATLPNSMAQTYDLTSPATDSQASVILAGANRTDVDFGYRDDATLGDRVWNDMDNDGVQDAGEPGIEGVLVYVDLNNDNVFDQGVEPFAVTDTNGNYQFKNLAAGAYSVRVEISTLPRGATQTYDLDGLGSSHEASRTVALSQDAADVDFGYRSTASVGDFVWLDSDADGVLDPGETGINGVRVYLDMNGNGVFDTATEPSAITAGGGAYTISGLVAGTYTARVDNSTLPPGMIITHDLAGDLDGIATFMLSPSQARIDLDFGYTLPVAIGDRVWNDLNANGVQDGGEPGLDGVSVTLYNAVGNTIAATAVTSGGGIYALGNLLPGTYFVEFDAFPGYARTLANQGADTDDSDADPVNGRTGTVTLLSGQSNLTWDAGYYQPGSVFGHLYIDTNGDGNQDPGEPDLTNVNVIVTDVNGASQIVATDSNGNWTASVPPGSTIADVDETDPQYPSGYTRTEGSDPTVVIAVSGESNDAGIDGYFLPGSISGTVLADNDGDADGDIPLAGVVIRLMDSLGEPVLDGLGDPVTINTLPDGTYGFAGLPPGSYRVYQDQPAGYDNVSDNDGANNNRIGDETPINVTAGDNSGGNDFIEIQLGVISGYVLLDTDNNGSGDAPLPGVVLNLLDDTGDPVLDGFGDPIRVSSGADGFYTFTLVPVGSYRVSQNQPATYGSVSDVDGANNNVIGDEAPIIMTPGLVVTDRNFVEIELGALRGFVLADTDADGSGDVPLAGVTLSLLDGSGQPVLDGSSEPVTTVTGADGSYRFDDLLPGDYQVAETQPSGYGSVNDVDGGDPDLIGNVIPFSVPPGGTVSGRNFVEVEFGSISGYVLAGLDPLAGVTLTLLDSSGNPVDGNSDLPGVQPVTTVTDSNGYYGFTGVIPGNYQVAQTQPPGYDSFGDLDGENPDIIGDVTLITVLPGEENSANNFVETLDTCPDDWAQWKFQHPGETAAGNPDADRYDNLAEFAFAMPASNGGGSPWLGETAWIIRPSALDPEILEGVFVRPKGATDHVTYTLQYAATLGNQTAWQSVAIAPVVTTVDNGDCTETVIIPDLETLTGLTGGQGVVRIQVDLDEENDTVIDHTSHSEVEGWKETGLDLCCRTYNNPFLRETVFTGTVGTVTGHDLGFPVSGGDLDFSLLLSPGAAFFVEVTSGENEGHRFDVVSATADSLTLANDSNLFEESAPHNTRTGALPADLAGDTLVLRRHWTLGETFPADQFGGTDDRTTADQVQLFTGGQWIIYWLYDDGVLPPRWVRTGDNTYADQGSTVLAPGQGLYFNNRTAVTSILSFGEVRENDFIRPLAPGSNLVSGGYPLDQSATGRAMGVVNGFFGSRDTATADSFFVWRGDDVIGQNGYDTYFLNNNAPRLPSIIKWAKIGDASLLSRDTEILLLGNRSVFLRSKDGLPGYTIPNPWTP